jgi:hypothetical protein
MYVPAHNIENPEQEIVCLMTGESYVYLDGDNTSLTRPEHVKDAIDALPPRFYKQPFIVRKGNSIRVFGGIE